jgi:hypothetical protein
MAARSNLARLHQFLNLKNINIPNNTSESFFWVLEVFSWVDARLSRTQHRGTRTRTRTRKRLIRFKSITFSGKL